MTHDDYWRVVSDGHSYRTATASSGRASSQEGRDAKPNNEFLVLIGYVLADPDFDLMILVYPYTRAESALVSVTGSGGVMPSCPAGPAPDGWPRNKSGAASRTSS